MARPLSTKSIPRGLKERVFKPHGIPINQLQQVDLTLDGLEAIRLADLEGLYQEEAARRMGVSRATFARVLAAARGSVAEALVHGKAMEKRGSPCPGPVALSGPRRPEATRPWVPVPPR